MQKEQNIESLLLKGLRALSGLTFKDLAAEFNLSIQMIRLVILDPARFPVLAPKLKKRLIDGAAKNGFKVVGETSSVRNKTKRKAADSD